MHVYRDAIRAAGDGLAVRYAAILYPGDYDPLHSTLEALPAVPGSTELLDRRLAQLLSEWMT